MVSNVVLHSGYQLLSVFTFFLKELSHFVLLIQWLQAFEKNLRCKFYSKIAFYTNMLLLQKEKNNCTLVQNIDQNEFSKQKNRKMTFLSF